MRLSHYHSSSLTRFCVLLHFRAVSVVRSTHRRVRRSRALCDYGDDCNTRIRRRWGRLVPLVALPNLLRCRCRGSRISGICTYFLKNASSPVSSHSIDLPNSRLIFSRISATHFLFDSPRRDQQLGISWTSIWDMTTICGNPKRRSEPDPIAPNGRSKH
jgi:hypothetical protein